MHFFDSFLGNSILQWAISLGIFIVVVAAWSVLKRIFRKRIIARGKLAEQFSEFDQFLVNLLNKTKFFFILLSAVEIAAVNLELPHRVARVAQSLFVVALLLQVAIWADDGIRFFLTRILRQRESKRGHDPALLTSVSVLQFLCRFALYVLILILILDNLGFNVTTLVAGLGVGGIAVALAAQNILGDLFASLSIVLDKPFVVGDFIEVGPQKGRVEKIGLKTTRIRSLTGEQIVVSNTDLLHSRILNFARMEQKRIVVVLGIRYDTKSASLQKIPETLRNIVQAQSNTRVDYAYFKGFGESALMFELAYFIVSPNPAEYNATEEKVNFQIFQIFETQKIEFAFPTRTIVMEKQVELTRN
jgi:small-conductance mechanosensitive channel